MRSFSRLSAIRPGSGTQSGSSLIEVLVAILLVSIGLLGVAGLSGATQAYNKAAQVRLVGVGLANDLADRARVNIYGFDLGNYDIELSDNSTIAADDPCVDDTTDANLDEDPKDIAVAKTLAQDLAASDVNEFLCTVKRRLPQGDAIVTSSPSSSARDLDVWLLWKEPKTDEDDEDDDKGAFSLFNEGKGNCPESLSADDAAEYSCMYFKVGL